MISLILILTIIVSLTGLYISIQTIFETRKKFYEEFMQRKSNEIKEKNKSLGYLQDKKIKAAEENINSKNEKNEKT